MRWTLSEILVREVRGIAADLLGIVASCCENTRVSDVTSPSVRNLTEKSTCRGISSNRAKTNLANALLQPL